MLLGWLVAKRQEITTVGKDVEKLELFTLLVGVENSAATMENDVEVP